MIGVVIALAIVNLLAWLTGGKARLTQTAVFSAGFLFGMLAMFIAVHLYRWK